MGREVEAGLIPLARYNFNMSITTKRLLELVASWPEEDIEKLENAARAIEEWRSEEYRAIETEMEE